MKSILDRTFRYTPSAETDLRKTFARIRREQQKKKRDEEKKAPPVVTPIRKVGP